MLDGTTHFRRALAGDRLIGSWIDAGDLRRIERLRVLRFHGRGIVGDTVEHRAVREEARASARAAAHRRVAGGGAALLIHRRPERAGTAGEHDGDVLLQLTERQKLHAEIGATACAGGVVAEEFYDHRRVRELRCVDQSDVRAIRAGAASCRLTQSSDKDGVETVVLLIL